VGCERILFYPNNAFLNAFLSANDSATVSSAKEPPPAVTVPSL
jgi:hypothetical protein